MATLVENEVRVRPNFLFIGGDRCGSKSLHNIFLQHPDCYVPPIADPYYFDKNYHRGEAWYLSLFAAAPAGVTAVGEFSHDYIHSSAAARRIAADVPDVRLLATLRHPIDRTYSSYIAARAAGVITTDFEQALDEVPMLIGNSLYADKLDVYFGLFDRDRIKVLFFEDLEANPKSFAAQAFAFLGLETLDSIDYGQRMNQLAAPQFPLAGVISKQGANLLRRLGWVNILGRLKHSGRFRSLFYKPYGTGEKPQMSVAARRRLQQAFAGQIDRLEEILGRNLAHWRE